MAVLTDILYTYILDKRIRMTNIKFTCLMCEMKDLLQHSSICYATYPGFSH